MHRLANSSASILVAVHTLKKSTAIRASSATMDTNPHAHEAENEQGPPRFATGGNRTPLRRRGQYNMHRQIHRLAMQPQSERASNLLFGVSYGSPSIHNLRRPQYSPGGSATMTSGGTPLTLPSNQPFNHSGQPLTPSPGGFMSTYRPVQTNQGRIGSGHPSEHAFSALSCHGLC